ncbi:hypothetical protein FO519_003859 [Halicephalobus sp. NKZ332]|nr:hypothetical protein FO519_003859 [Halicephalobus sp. NKZ332]
MPRRPVLRTPEEEEEYRIRRRKRNTEIQRERRRKLKQQSSVFEEEQKVEDNNFNEVLSYISKIVTNPTVESPLFSEIQSFQSSKRKERSQENEEISKIIRRKKNTEAQRKRRAHLKELKLKDENFERPKRTPEEEDAYVNRKPGKKLQKTNVTNTTFKAKPLVILNRLSDKKTDDSTTNKVNLYEVLEKLHHLNESTLIHNLERFLKLVVPNPELLQNNLSKIIPVVGRLIHWEGITNDRLRNVLGKVLYRICILPENILSPHFNHFCTFVTLGLAHCKMSMKILSLKCINQLTQSQKSSAVKSRELFTAFLRFLACDCVVGKQTSEVMEYTFAALGPFVSVYTLKSEKDDNGNFLSIKIHNNSIEVESEAPEIIDPFEFKVCGFGSQSDSPVSELDGICTLFDSVFVYLGRIYSLDEFKPLTTGAVYGILNSLKNILQNYLEKNVVKKGIFGDALLKLADKNHFIDAVGQKADRKVLLWFQKLKSM